jgi:hypothetical protein
MPHDWGERLAETRAVVRDSFSAVTSGRPWRRLCERFGLAHHVAAVDVSHGKNAGWHPHLHVVVLGTRRLNDGEVRALRRLLYVAWAGAMRRAGRRLPSYQHGVDVERARSRRDVGRYVCQVVGEDDDDRRAWGVAQEAARTDLKRSHAPGHRSPWQVLESFAETGDADDLALWHEYEQAMKGATAVKLGRGLRAAVGLGAEMSDEEIVAVEVGGETVYTFTDAGAWLATCEVRGGRARVLRAAEQWGASGCARMVAAIVRRWQYRRTRLGSGASGSSSPTRPTTPTPATHDVQDHTQEPRLSMRDVPHSAPLRPARPHAAPEVAEAGCRDGDDVSIPARDEITGPARVHALLRRPDGPRLPESSGDHHRTSNVRGVLNLVGP